MIPGDPGNFHIDKLAARIPQTTKVLALIFWLEWMHERPAREIGDSHIAVRAKSDWAKTILCPLLRLLLRNIAVRGLPLDCGHETVGRFRHALHLALTSCIHFRTRTECVVGSCSQHGQPDQAQGKPKSLIEGYSWNSSHDLVLAGTSELGLHELNRASPDIRARSRPEAGSCLYAPPSILQCQHVK